MSSSDGPGGSIQQTSKPSDSLAVLKLAEEAIANNDPKTTLRLFDLMPLEQLEASETNSFFSNYMDLCTAYNRSECMKIVFEAWGRVYPESEKIPLFTKLFLIPMIDVNSISFTARVYPHYTYLEVMDDLVKYDSTPFMPIACTRAAQVFGEQPYETYKMLLEMSEDNNPEVANYLAGKIRKISPYASVPKWVSDFRVGTHQTPPLESEVKIPERIQTGFEIPPIDVIVDMLANGIEHSGLTLDDKEEAKRVLQARVSIATTAERIELLRPVIDIDQKIDLQSDEAIFRVLGPSNPLINGSVEEMQFGGCRMFVCAVFDFNTDTGYVEDWFSGFCHRCDLRIRTRWHAIRMPRPSGGWIGCYCSWKCVREAVYTTGVNLEGKPDMVTDLLIDEFETQINIIGVQDRIPNSAAEAERVSNAITSTVCVQDLTDNTKATVPSIPIVSEEGASALVYPSDTKFEVYGMTTTPTNRTVNLVSPSDLEPPASVEQVFGVPAPLSPGDIAAVGRIGTPSPEPTLVPLPEVPVAEPPVTGSSRQGRSARSPIRSPTRSPGSVLVPRVAGQPRVRDPRVAGEYPMISPPVFSPSTQPATIVHPKEISPLNVPRFSAPI